MTRFAMYQTARVLRVSAQLPRFVLAEIAPPEPGDTGTVIEVYDTPHEATAWNHWIRSGGRAGSQTSQPTNSRRLRECRRRTVATVGIFS